MRVFHSLLASTALGVIALFAPHNVKPAKADPQPCQWSYSFVGGQAVASYCGAVQSASSPSNLVANGGDPTGKLDSTPAFNKILATGSTSVYVPPGTYQVCGVKIPHTKLLHIYGAGTASFINHFSACGLPLFYWDTAAMDYSEQTISDLAIEGDGALVNNIETAGEGGLTLRQLYFQGVPLAKANIFVNGVGVTTHDVLLQNIFSYSSGGSVHGKAVVEFGNLATDSGIDTLISNGAFVVDYGILMDAGTQTIKVTNSHPYNAAINVLKAFNCLACQFSHNTWDNSLQAIASLTGVTNSTFTGDYFEAVNGGQSAIQLINSSGNIFTGAIIGSNGGAGGQAVVESGTSDYNAFRGGNIAAVSFAAPQYNLIGVHSYTEGVAGYTSLGINSEWQGVTTSAQAQNTSQFLGANGGNANFTQTAFSPYTSGVVSGATIGVSVAPAAGQTMTFTLMDGAVVLGSCVVSNPSFGCSINLAPIVFMNPLDQIYITSAFSATSGSAIVRYAIKYQI